jgi:hypothetical protein
MKEVINGGSMQSISLEQFDKDISNSKVNVAFA